MKSSNPYDEWDRKRERQDRFVNILSIFIILPLLIFLLAYLMLMVYSVIFNRKLYRELKKVFKVKDYEDKRPYPKYLERGGD